MSYRYTSEDLKKDIYSGTPPNVTEYLFQRIQCDIYRGVHVSQHNRYTKDEIIVILRALKETLESNKISHLRIRTTDSSKRPDNTSEEELYAQMTQKLFLSLNRITQDSLRKNFFVDMERMGLIYRYNKHGQRHLVGGPNMHYHSVNIGPLGEEFLQADPLNQDKCWNLALANLLAFHGFESRLYGLVSALGYIDLVEFAFFASDVSKTPQNIVSLINEFRALPNGEQIIDSIKKYANPTDNDIYMGQNKPALRDYNNWINEAMQVFKCLQDSCWFCVDCNWCLRVR
ncbi:hypothetical protein NHP20013_07580 [Helicobacter bizzozeronii]|nr:hypothetical protein NHP20013_07580 [Helicobacter bizzozeronii]